jgi:SNF family Na+-dependent transporter
MEENGGLFVIIWFVCVMAVGAAFLVGRKYEARYWEKAIPEQMNKLCNECANLN